ncbi:MAG: DUF2203 domain-containing protein [Calditrichia bacterium]
MSQRRLHKRYFSVAEAMQTLHMFHPMIDEMVRLTKSLLTAGYNIFSHKYFGGTSLNSAQKHPRELTKLVEILMKLDSAGILVNGLEEGLVDFPHIRKNGEEVHLCFKAGEETIKFWHVAEDGFAGRKPLDKL